MASVGHIAVGMAASRIVKTSATSEPPSGKAMFFWSALSMLPDADVIGFPLGVRYADEWGHRGATHSFVFAIVVGCAIGLVAPQLRAPALRTAFIASLVLLSHGLLDTLTDGGLGCALLWPFDRMRYFAPWRPIPVAPIGLGYLSPYGLSVAVTELVIFASLFIYALWPRIRGRRGTTSRQRKPTP
jgi:inner membrane protein